MKEIRDIKIDLLMGNKNPIIDLFCNITSGIEIINCNVYNEEGLEFIYHKDGQWIFFQDVKMVSSGVATLDIGHFLQVSLILVMRKYKT